MNVNDKAMGSAYTQVMPHSRTLATRVSTAWTISRPHFWPQEWDWLIRGTAYTRVYTVVVFLC